MEVAWWLVLKWSRSILKHVTGDIVSQVFCRFFHLDTHDLTKWLISLPMPSRESLLDTNVLSTFPILFVRAKSQILLIVKCFSMWSASLKVIFTRRLLLIATNFCRLMFPLLFQYSSKRLQFRNNWIELSTCRKNSLKQIQFK